MIFTLNLPGHANICCLHIWKLIIHLVGDTLNLLDGSSGLPYPGLWTVSIEYVLRSIRKAVCRLASRSGTTSWSVNLGSLPPAVELS